MHDPAVENFLAELHCRGIRRIRRIRFKNNKDRLLSVSRDGTLLNVHVCFAAAPADVLDAIALFLRARSGTLDSQRAVAVLRAWPGAREGLDRARAGAEGEAADVVPKPGACCGTPAQRKYLKQLYAQLNRARFQAGLPRDLPIRLSDRMASRYGHVRYHTARTGTRHVVELALNVDLMLEGNEKDLVDTMLHEMAHIEVWLAIGHRGHGRPWRRIARRVGCEPRACATTRLKRRRRRNAVVTRVPAIPQLEQRLEARQIDLFELVA